LTICVFSWTAIDVDDFASDVELISFTLTGLQAFTQYAYYVKAFEPSKVSQSEIQYFTTAAGKPGTVTLLTATSKSDSEIVKLLINFQ
jgi:hypothetical protein